MMNSDPLSSSFVTRPLSGWGRYPVERCHLFRPERRADVGAILASGVQGSYIAHGLGRSYGDAALNRESGVIGLRRLNRFLSFDAATGVLECEAGVSLAEILRHFLPRGFFLPVTPGTKFVTVGGAIASDIHGKNHHRDGTFANFVLDFKLLGANGELWTCSPAAHPEIFWATSGGMGLTGVILSARIRLRRVESAFVLVDYQRTKDLHEALRLMRESDDRYEYSVAWLDGLARGKSLGRSVLMRGSHARVADLGRYSGDPLVPRARRRWSVPFDLPSFCLNPLTVGAFNSLYYHGHGNAAGRAVSFEEFFYPLDSVQNWNRLYGRRGFVQYQVALPEGSGATGLTALVEKLARSRRAAFLAVVKRFGEASAGLLSFPMKGYTLALDLPVAAGLFPFLRELDRVVLGHGGRVYLAKDAALEPATTAEMYPNLERFREIKQRLDPYGLLSSSLARRVGLTEVFGHDSERGGPREAPCQRS